MEKVKEKNEAGESVKIKQIVGIEKIGAGWEMKKKMLGPKKLEPEKVKSVLGLNWRASGFMSEWSNRYATLHNLKIVDILWTFKDDTCT